MEPLRKELMPGLHASINSNGTLTLTEENVIVHDVGEEDEVTITTIDMPAVAVRALLNMLRTEAARTLIGYRRWQKEGSGK